MVDSWLLHVYLYSQVHSCCCSYWQQLLGVSVNKDSDKKLIWGKLIGAPDPTTHFEANVHNFLLSASAAMQVVSKCPQHPYAGISFLLCHQYFL